jgi:hypothetical protein
MASAYTLTPTRQRYFLAALHSYLGVNSMASAYTLTPSKQRHLMAALLSYGTWGIKSIAKYQICSVYEDHYGFLRLLCYISMICVKGQSDESEELSYLKGPVRCEGKDCGDNLTGER